MPKEDQELLYAIWAMEVLVSSGIGLESAIKHVAEGNYGKISKEFKRVLGTSSTGMTESLGKALDKLATETKSKSFRKTLNTLTRSLSSDTGVGETLKTIAERETQERKTKMQGFVEKLGLVSELFLMVLMVPIVIVVMSFTALLPFGGGSMVTPTTTRLILFSIIFLLVMLMVWAKIMESEA